jgi:hypothetical protein
VANGLDAHGWWDGVTYGQNRCAVDPESLRRYLGEWLAWDLLGTKVVAHHEDAQEVVRQVREMGLGMSRVVMEHLLGIYADDEYASVTTKRAQKAQQ